MESTAKRFSVNTSLMNARIFDDDSWDEEVASFTSNVSIKKEPTVTDFSEENGKSNNQTGKRYFQEIKVEMEDFQNTSSNGSIHEEKTLFQNVKIKKEIQEESEYSSSSGDEEENVAPYVKIKKEILDSDEDGISQRKGDSIDMNSADFEDSYFNDIPKIKKNVSRQNFKGETFEKDSNNSNSEFEENYLDNVDRKIKLEIINTPNKISNLLTEDSNPSPFNKDLFKHFNLKQDDYRSPEPSREVRHNTRLESRKSVKRTVFERNSPYKKYEPQEGTSRVIAKRRPELNEDQDENTKKRRKQPEMETDPLILSRRQKQIDFGKNTIGYDNYTRTVPKEKRTREDAHTPNKFIKYSRRGWDGLIKQWRVRLHKYDPDN